MHTDRADQNFSQRQLHGVITTTAHQFQPQNSLAFQLHGGTVLMHSLAFQMTSPCQDVQHEKFVTRFPKI